MTPHIPEEFSTRVIDLSPFVIMGNTMPPRDPDEDEEDEEEEGRGPRRRNAGRARAGRRLEHVRMSALSTTQTSSIIGG